MLKLQNLSDLICWNIYCSMYTVLLAAVALIYFLIPHCDGHFLYLIQIDVWDMWDYNGKMYLCRLK